MRMSREQRMASFQRRTGLKPCGRHRPLYDRLKAEGLSYDKIRAIVLLQFPDAGATQIIDPDGLIYYDLLKGVMVDVER